MYINKYILFSPLQDTVVKQNLIRTIDLIGRALHPDHLKKTDFVFSKRGDLISHLLVRTCAIFIAFHFPCLPIFSFIFYTLLLPHICFPYFLLLLHFLSA